MKLSLNMHFLIITEFNLNALTLIGEYPGSIVIMTKNWSIEKHGKYFYSPWKKSIEDKGSFWLW